MSYLRYTVLLLLILSLARAYAGKVEKVFEFGDPVIERQGDYSVISFAGCRLFGEAGKAILPFFPVRLLLPPGEMAASVTLDFEEETLLPGEYLVLPRQRTRPLSEAGSGGWIMDEIFYSAPGVYPPTKETGIQTHFLHGHPIGITAFTPMRYEPSTGRVSYYRKVRVVIGTAPGLQERMTALDGYPSLKNIEEARRNIQNPEDIWDHHPSREFLTSEYDYLVITRNEYLDAFDTLKSFYLPRGVRVNVFSTEYISAGITGNDLQEKIRNFIIQEYEDQGISAVLIGGDAEIVPYRGFYCYVQSGGGYSDSGIPADLYYSALDGNWNTDGDSYWGEPGEDDLFPEVAVGRMTFSTSAELQRMLHKTFSYQGAPVTGELTHPMLAGEYLWNNPITWGSDYMRLLVGYRTDNGYTTQGIPPGHPIDSLYERYQSWGKTDLMNKINSGKPWLHHCGHANYTYAMKLSNGDITNANFAQANGVSHNYVIVYTHGCNCGGFDYNDCIAEKMIGIDNFAVAFLGNSRYGWFVEGTTDGPSQHLHREFMDAIYRDSLYRLGPAHMQSKTETAPFVDLPGEYEPGATRWCFYDNNLLGDPMLAAWTEEPWAMQVQYPALIPAGLPEVQVQLGGGAAPCEGFTCSLYRNDTLFGAALSGPTGLAVIQPEGWLARGPVSLVISGYNILPAYFDMEVSDFWLGITTDWSDPGNWFSGTVPDEHTPVVIPAMPQGGCYPSTNSLQVRECKTLLLEPGAVFTLNPGETFNILSY